MLSLLVTGSSQLGKLFSYVPKMLPEVSISTKSYTAYTIKTQAIVRGTQVQTNKRLVFGRRRTHASTGISKQQKLQDAERIQVLFKMVVDQQK